MKNVDIGSVRCIEVVDCPTCARGAGQWCMNKATGVTTPTRVHRTRITAYWKVLRKGMPNTLNRESNRHIPRKREPDLKVLALPERTRGVAVEMERPGITKEAP